jgi:hypothetical protein
MDKLSKYVVPDEDDDLTDEGTVLGQLRCGVDVGLGGFAIAVVTHDGKVFGISRESESEA